MSKRFPPPPPLGAPLLAARPDASARRLLALRRSASARHLRAPGPSPSDLNELLQIAARVPDHRRLSPWRFIVFEGEARHAFGQELAKIYDRKTPDAASHDVMDVAGLPSRAPTVVAVISSPDIAHKTPVWEQELSAGAVCYNLLVAANASGWAGVWLTEWMAFDPDVAALLELGANERVAGFIYLGTATLAPVERARIDIATKVTRWSPEVR